MPAPASPGPSGTVVRSPLKEYGRRVTLTTAPTAGCAAWKSSSPRSMFFLPMKPCGHCVHVTKSASTRSVAARGAPTHDPGSALTTIESSAGRRVVVVFVRGHARSKILRA